MPNFSQWTGCGHLGRDAETRQAGQSQVVSFSVAVTRKRRDTETTMWVRCSWFGPRAVKVAQYLTKGKAIIVSGELYEGSYEKDGQARKSLECDVHDVVLLGGGERSDAATARPAAPPRQPSSEADNDPPF